LLQGDHLTEAWRARLGRGHPDVTLYRLP
jgi:hypothetical protein